MPAITNWTPEDLGLFRAILPSKQALSKAGKNNQQVNSVKPYFWLQIVLQNKIINLNTSFRFGLHGLYSLTTLTNNQTHLVISNFHLEYVGTWLWYNIILATRPDKMTQHQPLPAAQLCLSAQECLKAQLVLSVHFGSTSLSLVTWIFAPDLSWRYLIVFLGFPIITTTLPFGISIFLLVPWYPYEEYRGAPLCEDNGGIEEPCLNTSAMCPLYQPEQQGSTTKFS